MRRFARSISLCGLVVLIQLVCVSWLQAQAAPEIAPGSRIRVSTGPGVGAPDRLITTLVRLTADSLTVISPADGAELAIPNSSVARLEVSGGKQSRALRGLAIGAAAGTVVGGGLAWALIRGGSCEGELCGTGFDDMLLFSTGAVDQAVRSIRRCGRTSFRPPSATGAHDGVAEASTGPHSTGSAESPSG